MPEGALQRNKGLPLMSLVGNPEDEKEEQRERQNGECATVFCSIPVTLAP